MEWNCKTILRFLELYEMEPVIWDQTHAQHKNRNDVYDAWKRIQEKFPMNLSVMDLKKKKDSLMATYRNCLAKVRRSSKGGAADDEIYTPSWFAFKKMASFLGTHDTPKESNNSDVNSQVEYTEASHSDKSEMQYDLSDDESTMEPNLCTCGGSLTRNTRTRSKKRKTFSDDLIYEKMEKAYQNLNQSPKKKDECEIFGDLITTRLRKLDEFERDYTMHQIEKVMYQTKVNFSRHKPSSSHPELTSERQELMPSPSFITDSSFDKIQRQE